MPEHVKLEAMAYVTLHACKRLAGLSFSAEDDWQGNSGQIDRAFSQMSGRTASQFFNCSARFEIFDLALSGFRNRMASRKKDSVDFTRAA